MGTVYNSDEKICSVYRENPSKFIEDILKVHNRYRAIHNSPPLQIDEKVEHFLSLLNYLFENSIESANFSILATRVTFFKFNYISLYYFVKNNVEKKDDY